VLHANGVLRTTLGWTPRVQDRAGPALAAKLVVASAHKAWTRATQGQPVLPETFTVESHPA